jgi:hypothetical protein
LPNNAKWNSTTQQYFIQTWVTNSYSPSSKNAFYSENQEECAYGCAELTKECQPDPVMYCGSGQQDCNFGTWTACIPTSANICTTNQYCENNMCTFCFDTNKNCDSNLLNGCETNLLTNSENCGACGLRCNSGIDCVNGVCENNIIDVNLCESTFCGENSSCNPINGNCACAIGYYNCDEDGDNGCEKSSPCTIIPAYECILDSNCDSTEECKNGFCVSKPVVILPGHCENDSDCDTNESCISSTCQEVICGSGFTINNHSCRCTGEICNNTCYAEEGICCNNRWNKNLDSCLFETETISITVDASKNQDAIDLLEQAKSSIDSGEILKGKAQALTAELKALIETKNQPSYNEKYEEALLAIKEKDYEKATTISLETKEKLNESQNGGIEFYIMAFCAMVVVIGIIVGLFKIIQKK